MGLFGKKDSYVGVDIGTSGIKVVEIGNDQGKPRLVTYGYLDEPINVLRSDTAEAVAKAVKIIKEIFKQAKVGSNRVVSALPSFTVFSAIISLPNMSRKEMVSAVRWEAKKFVPMPIEEMILDWKILEEKKGEEAKPESPPAEKKTGGQGQPSAKSLNILLTAAPRNLVQRYLAIYKELGVKLIGLETEAFALERSLIGHDKSAVMIVDIGGLNTNVCVMRDSIPLLNRSIDVGGETITRTIANSLNVELERAEQFKRDFGMSSTDESGGQQQIPKTIEFVISSIINEIKYCFSLYHNQSLGPTDVNKAIEKVILTGGSAFLPSLPEYLSKVLNMRVYIGDPWARVSHPEELKPVLAELGPKLSVAIGLAMREIN